MRWGMMDCQKAQFNLPEGVTFLNSAYMGPLPSETVKAGLRALEKRSLVVGLTSEDFFKPAEKVRSMIAKLINCKSENIFFTNNVSSVISLVAKNLPKSMRKKILVLENQFPSNVYPWQKTGKEIIKVSSGSNAFVDLNQRAKDWNQNILNAIDEDTWIVAIETAHWTDGTKFEIDLIAEKCGKKGALFVIDATQTAAILPMDIQKLKPDVLVVHCYKSMLCNYGLGFCYFSDELLSLNAFDESWLLRKGAEDFSKLIDYEDVYADGARKFDTSSRANPILIDMLEASLNFLMKLGPEEIQKYLYQISERPIQKLRANGFAVADRDFRVSNIFGVYFEKTINPSTIQKALADRKIYVSIRGSSVRVSPHVYNSESDLNEFADAILEITEK
jgi:selenocysteine lyase/cysteine desulfurase